MQSRRAAAYSQNPLCRSSQPVTPETILFHKAIPARSFPFFVNSQTPLRACLKTSSVIISCKHPAEAAAWNAALEFTPRLLYSIAESQERAYAPCYGSGRE